MNPIDAWVFSLLGKYYLHSEALNRLIYHVMDSNMVKGGALMVILWWIWFSGSHDQLQTRRIVIGSLIAAFVAVFVTKVIEHSLPPRPRPINNPLVESIFSYSPAPSLNTHWEQSAFPSDHAALFFALAFALFYASRRLGVAVFVYVLVAISLPRVYNGVHYATDILAGAGIALVSALVINIRSLRDRMTSAFVDYAERKPGIFYPLFFILTFEVSVLFGDVREFGSFFFRLL